VNGVRRSDLSDRRLAVLASLLLLSGLAVALVVVRVAYTMHPHYGGMIWNLFLAWLPFVFALAVYDGYRRGTSRPLLAGAALLWLLFFPNAPYIVTDFKHLRVWDDGMPILYDAVMLSAFAWAALALAFTSLYLMQSVGRRALGFVNSWLLVVCVLGVSSFGIYLGRFERWNSWDVFVRPRLVFGELLDPLAEKRAVAVTLLFTAFLTVTYLVFYTLMRLAAVERRER
jgi:uncharacterized membrane protein